MYGIIFLFICLLINALVKEDVVKEKPESRPFIYKVNGRQCNLSLEQYYLQLLDLTNCKSIDTQTVSSAYYDKLGKIADRRFEGETIYVELIALKAAKEYLIDACNYLAYRN